MPRMTDIPSGAGAHVYSPSELNREVKMHLEAGFPRLLVEGEISNLSRPASGHCYFSLKDERAQLRCAMFRSSVQRCPVELRNGLQVVVRGRIGLYEARGDFQMIVDGAREAGEGALQQAFEALKKKLADEGLFAAERKRPLPRYPWRIGLITSPSGAAVRDLMHVLRRRWPVAEVRLYGAAVQGAEAAGELRAALARANREAWAEVLILGRGGGSLEDLMAFNDEALARAVAGSALPVISAVGHETDFSICDFVADERAPTPSAAAERATPDIAQVSHALERFARMLRQRALASLQQRWQRFDHLAHRLNRVDPARRLDEQQRRLRTLETGLRREIDRHLERFRRQADEAARRLAAQHPRRLLADRRDRLTRLSASAGQHLRIILERARHRLAEQARTLHAVSPLATLQRGYAAVADHDSGRILTSVSGVRGGDRIDARLADGRLECTVDAVVSGGDDPAIPDS